MPFWIQLTVPLLSFLLSAFIGTILIPRLKKLGMRQTINKYIASIDGKKEGTPMMGGFMFIIASIVSLAVGMALFIAFGGQFHLRSDNNALYKLIAGLVFALLNSSLGFADDYVKAVQKKNDGIKMRQKLIPQFIFAAAFVYVLYLLGDRSTAVWLPIFGELELSWFYYPLMVCFAVYLTNAVNLTDGVDGLCGTMTVVSGLALAMLSTRYGSPEYTLFSLAVAGGCLGFLVHNLHPAKVFMGDTGSMFLGGFITAVGFALHAHFLLIIIALIYILDALTVLIQRLYYRITRDPRTGKGKRIFPKTPIHHGFQEMGLSDNKVTILFAACTLLCGIAANLTAYLT
ncbi:MAG: phospho-N-acetylmuramoyl-pentapeptide-transferase [Ruminococcus sp.]|jgi:phospho-N-acetylmuramoyl-pentapeptide-transferase|nr:phospho-N-acetylmuramoyl-pentapeptide-transferase [Ruminococcus sp.]